MGYRLEFDKFVLFDGDDLEKAAAMSEIVVSKRGPARVRQFQSLRRLIQDTANVRFRDLLPNKVIVSGVERESGERMSMLFSGPPRILDYCANAIFGSDAYVEDRTRNRRKCKPDVIVSIPRASLFTSRNPCSIRSPQWVCQVLELRESWPETVATLRNRLRKEISRTLRKYGYRVAMSSGSDALSRFKKELLDPSLKIRHGRSAIVARDSQFIRESRDMFLLDLYYEDSVVAGSLLEYTGDRLAIRKSALQPGSDELRGRADVLDYYCLLTAQLLGCGVLDFGLSRPHLEDGTFRYKAKWGTRVLPVEGLKADIRINPWNYSTAVRAFLRRSFFLQRTESAFTVRVLYDDESPPSANWRLWRLADIEGIDMIEMLCQTEMPITEVPLEWSHCVRQEVIQLDHDVNPACRMEP